jgi:hypothetical protein
VSAWADHQAIVDVTLAYAWSLDSRSWGGLDQVFAAAASATLLGRHSEGRDAIVDRIKRSLAPFDSTQHIITNHQVTATDDGAECRCYLQAQHMRRGAPGGELFTIAGYYEDRFIHTAEGWRIAHRTLTEMWRSGNPDIAGKN